ncbi:MAG: ATP-binding protein, partial [Candidatus Omnitrophota bacterium]
RSDKPVLLEYKGSGRQGSWDYDIHWLEEKVGTMILFVAPSWNSDKQVLYLQHIGIWPQSWQKMGLSSSIVEWLYFVAKANNLEFTITGDDVYLERVLERIEAKYGSSPLVTNNEAALLLMLSSDIAHELRNKVQSSFGKLQIACYENNPLGLPEDLLSKLREAKKSLETIIYFQDRLREEASEQRQLEIALDFLRTLEAKIDSLNTGLADIEKNIKGKGYQFAVRDKVMLNLDDQVNRAIAVLPLIREIFAAFLQGGVKQQLDINRILEEANRLTDTKLLINQLDYEDVKEDFASGLPLVLADHTQLKIIFTNLLFNAYDALKGKDNPQVRIRTRYDPGSRKVVIEISDNGQGISSDNIPRIFDQYFTTKGKLGTGLGLNIVKRMVEENSGTISVASELGKNTTFTITLPAATSSPAAVDSNTAASPLVGTNILGILDSLRNQSPGIVSGQISPEMREKIEKGHPVKMILDLGSGSGDYLLNRRRLAAERGEDVLLVGVEPDKEWFSATSRRIDKSQAMDTLNLNVPVEELPQQLKFDEIVILAPEPEPEIKDIWAIAGGKLEYSEGMLNYNVGSKISGALKDKGAVSILTELHMMNFGFQSEDMRALLRNTTSESQFIDALEEMGLSRLSVKYVLAKDIPRDLCYEGSYLHKKGFPVMTLLVYGKSASPSLPLAVDLPLGQSQKSGSSPMEAKDLLKLVASIEEAGRGSQFKSVFRAFDNKGKQLPFVIKIPSEMTLSESYFKEKVLEFAKKNMGGIFPSFNIIDGEDAVLLGKKYPYLVIQKDFSIVFSALDVLRLPDEYRLPNGLEINLKDKKSDIEASLVKKGIHCPNLGSAHYGLDPGTGELYLLDFSHVHFEDIESYPVQMYLKFDANHLSRHLRINNDELKAFWATQRDKCYSVPDVEAKTSALPLIILEPVKNEIELKIKDWDSGLESFINPKVKDKIYYEGLINLLDKIINFTDLKIKDRSQDSIVKQLRTIFVTFSEGYVPEIDIMSLTAVKRNFELADMRKFENTENLDEAIEHRMARLKVILAVLKELINSKENIETEEIKHAKEAVTIISKKTIRELLTKVNESNNTNTLRGGEANKADDGSSGSPLGEIDGSTKLAINSGHTDVGGIDMRTLALQMRIEKKEIVSPPSGARNDTEGAAPPNDTEGAALAMTSSPELQEIQRLIQAGIIPATKRLEECRGACSANALLSCIADILRIEEERVMPTDAGLKNLLALIETSGYPG